MSTREATFTFAAFCESGHIIMSLNDLKREFDRKKIDTAQYRELFEGISDVDDILWGPLSKSTVAAMMEQFGFSDDEQIQCVKKLLPDSIEYTDLQGEDLVVQFPHNEMLWSIGDALYIPEVLTKVLWPTHWMIGHMRLKLLRRPGSRVRVSLHPGDTGKGITDCFEKMDRVWTASGYRIFYNGVDQDDLDKQMTDARDLAQLLRTICPAATSDFVDVFHIVNRNRPGLGNDLPVRGSHHIHPWQTLHAFACYGYGCYCGDVHMPLLRLRLHKSVASIATFSSEQAVFVVLADTTCHEETLDTRIPETCTRCDAIFTRVVTETSNVVDNLKFYLRANRGTTVATAPSDLTGHIAVCRNKMCNYVYGCPTYIFHLT
tara:strand:- start:375 stop:1499 length:1125 start_codon:yes stop_codon:yes gene_type:complete